MVWNRIFNLRKILIKDWFVKTCLGNQQITCLHRLDLSYQDRIKCQNMSKWNLSISDSKIVIIGLRLRIFIPVKFWAKIIAWEIYLPIITMNTSVISIKTITLILFNNNNNKSFKK